MTVLANALVTGVWGGERDGGRALSLPHTLVPHTPTLTLC